MIKQVIIGKNMKSPHSLGLIGEVSRLLRKRFEQRAQNLGLSRLQWRTLAFLSKNEGIHQAALAELLEVEPISLVRVLDQLSARGFVERRAHPTDRRLWLLHTKEAVHPLLSKIHDLADLTYGEATDGISAEELHQALNVLTTIRGNLVQACATPVAEDEKNHG